MADLLSAGAYHREIDLSLFVPASGETSQALVGAAHKGEKDEIIEVSSQSDYISKLGIPTTPMGRAAFEYLRNGRDLKAVRVASGDVQASADLDDSGAVKTITIKGKTSGEQFNGIKIFLSSGAAAGKFRLVVEEEGFPVESWENLDKASIESIINDAVSGSAFIVAENDLGNVNEPAIPQEVTLSGGNSGITGLSDSDYIGTVTGTTKTGLQLFSNPEDVLIDLLAIPGNSASAVITAIFSLLDLRKDAYGLIDPPLGLNVDEVIDFVNGTGAYTGQHPAFNTHRAELSWPWHKIYDSYLEQEVWVPPSGITSGIIANSDNISQPWFAAAGFQRGQSVNSLAIEYSPDQTDRDRLGPQNRINPYVNFKGKGIVRWGQETLYRTPTALQNENIRRMLYLAEKKVGDVVLNLNFEPNDPRTQKDLKRLIENVLDPIQAGRGIYDYRVITDSTINTPDVIDRDEMFAKILIKPTRTTEVIRLDWTILRTSASFEEFI